MTISIGSGITIGNGISLDVASASIGAIVTSGLILNLDAGNASSYPGTGTTWTDISGSGYTGSMGTGVTYSSSYGGVMTFSGATTAFVTMVASGLASLTNNFTVEAWYQSNFGNPYYRPEILANNSGSNGFVFGYFASVGNYTNWKVTKYNVIDLYVGSIPQNTSWHQAVLTYSSTTGTSIYIDGSLTGNNSNATNLNVGTSTFGIGKGESTTYMHNGSIGIVRWYNTPLSATSVLQNFTATRSRYGI